jgi:hypothetical protein
VVTSEEVRHWDFCIYTYRAVSSHSKELLLPIKAPLPFVLIPVPYSNYSLLIFTQFPPAEGNSSYFFFPIHETRHPLHRGPHCIQLGYSVGCSLARSKAIILSLGVTDQNYKLILCQVTSLSLKFDTEFDFSNSSIRII